jgi:L-2-hydroxyglutarate oxidase LhgO
MSGSGAYSAETVVIGAGVVGIAVARAFAMAGHEVLVLEQEGRIGQHQSSHNSEVIHSGIYYSPSSVKARLCLSGRTELYAFAAERGIPHRRVGKLVVATESEQVAKLRSMYAASLANGVEDVTLLDRSEAKAKEPALECMAALWSPSTGVIDSHAYLLALQAEAEQHGATFAFNARLRSGEVKPSGFRLRIDAPEPTDIDCRHFINCGGLFAPALMRTLAGYPAERIPHAWFARGNYFACQCRVPFDRLIYPVPDQIGLGIHLTLDVSGGAKFGPDVELVDKVSYAIDPSRAEHFYTSIRRYWPGLPDGVLVPAYAGVRAKIGPRDVVQDFLIETEADHHIPGLINLFGIESPGLTSSLAIGREVVHRAAAYN